MLAYYIDGIKKIFDYKSTANRKDLNLYILNYILLSIGISLFFGIIYLVVGLNDFFISLNVGVKNIHYGDILVKYNTCINDEIDKIPNINSDINLNKISDDNYLKVGDVILADTAEDYTVGKACEIVSCKVKILSGLHTIPCRPTQNFAKGYLGYYLNSAEYHDKLIPLITGIKVSAISKKEIKKTIIKYPIYKEQEKIANLLLLIDNKLNANIKKLELFETYQKGLLQQLFI